MKDDFEWIRSIGECLVGFHGKLSSMDIIYERLYALNRLQILGENHPLSAKQIADFCSHLIGRSLRSSTPFEMNLMIGGWDQEEDQPILYWIDKYGTCKTVTYAGHGQEFIFLLSILDQKQTEMIHQQQQQLNDIEIISIFPLIKTCWEVIQRRSPQHLAHVQTLAIQKTQHLSALENKKSKITMVRMPSIVEK
jgi:20S proteasome subunit beta 4